MALREAKKLADERKRERLEEKRARYYHNSLMVVTRIVSSINQRKSQRANCQGQG